MSSTWELGDAVPLTWTISSGGTPTNATVTLTVTAPDGTTSNPTVSNPSTGSYTASVVPALNGRYSAKWTATGAVTAAETVEFTVGGIVALADIKKQLNKTSAADDAELQDYIDAVTAAIEDYCGPVVARPVTEYQDVTSSTIVLRQAPVASVTTLTAYSGTTGTVYTEAADPTAVTDYAFYLDAPAGLVSVVGNNGFPAPISGRVQIVYTAGMAQIPPAINLAARILVQSLWRTQNGGAGLPALSDETDSQQFLYDTIRSGRVQMLLAPFRRAPRAA